MAQAVQQAFPEAKLGIGPPVENGFYYDFQVDRAFTPEDLKSVESRMRDIVKQGQRFVRREVTDAEARAELADEPFKLELIGIKGSTGSRRRGVHRGRRGRAHHLRQRGRQDRRAALEGPVPRPARAVHQAHPGVQADAQRRRVLAGQREEPAAAADLRHRVGDHGPRRTTTSRCSRRPSGATTASSARSSTCSPSPRRSAPGLPVFHPKGGIIRRELENYSRRGTSEAGYSFVDTPHITKGHLFETSGHLPYYADTMFPPMELEGSEYYLKAMNCPMHNLIFRSRGRSYRELPLRLFEFGTVYRYEKSGVVHGLTRVRGLTMDDSHIYCTREQMEDELKSVLAFVLDLLRDYGLDDFYLELSTRGDSDKFIGSDEEWESATKTLRTVAEASGLELVPDPGGAAFYGPKISVQARDAIGRTWQMSTVQLDFNQPKRFGLEYTAADGTRQQPIMIHRALFGSIERFMGVLIEHYAGAHAAVAGAGAGGGHPDRRRPRAVPERGRRGGCAPGASASRSTTAPTGCRRRSAPRRSRRSRSCCWPATTTWRRARSRSATAPARRRTACPIAEAIDEIVAAVESRAQV